MYHVVVVSYNVPGGSGEFARRTVVSDICII